MQAKSRIWTVLLVVLISSLLLAACGGGSSGKTWFNLPGATVKVQQDGSVKMYGLPVPGVKLPVPQIEKLQAAGVQELGLRWGYNGLHVYVNGEDMPYLIWDEASAATMKSVLAKMPGLPYAGQIAGNLPRLRQVGGGLRIVLPVAAGATKLDIPKWKGETSVSPAEVSEPTIGPLEIGDITFDEQGNGYKGSVPLDRLGAPVVLPANVLSIINAIGLEKLSIKTEPGGMQIQFNDMPFPSVAYDAAYLQRAVDLLGKVSPNSPFADTLAKIATDLPGAAVTAQITFDGEPAGVTDLSNLEVAVNPDGSISALGIPVPGGSLIPAATLDMLRSANMQNVNLNLAADGLSIVNNGQPLPAIGWTPAGLEVVKTLAPALAGISREQIEGVVDVINETKVGLSISIPPAEGEAVADKPASVPETPSYAPVDLGEFAPPIIRADLQLDANGAVTNIGNLAMSDVTGLGLPANIVLPANVIDILKQTGASEVGVQTEAGKMEIQLDGETAITLAYDVPALQEMWALVKPLIKAPIVENPAISTLIEERFVPLAAGAQADISLQLTQ